MQETQGPDGELMREFFKGKEALDEALVTEEIKRRMDDRYDELKKGGHTLVRRAKVGRNDACPCGSGKKFKQCCIDQSQ